MTRVPNITLIEVEHSHPKCDVPELLRAWEEHAAVLGVAIIMVGSYCGSGCAYAAFAALLCVAGGFGYWRRTLVYPRAAESQSPVADTGQSNVRSRLVCYGAPCELDELRRVRDAQFPPFIARRRKSLSRIPWKARALHALSAGDILAMVCAVVMYVLGLPWWSIVGVVVLVSMFPWAIGQTVHEYYRVTPQRLDRQRYSVWSTEARSLDTFSLDDAEVTCRYDKQELFIRSAGESTTPLAIDLSRLRSPHAFVDAVFRAAVCCEAVPLLPSDRLLG